MKTRFRFAVAAAIGLVSATVSMQASAQPTRPRAPGTTPSSTEDRSDYFAYIRAGDSALVPYDDLVRMFPSVTRLTRENLLQLFSGKVGPEYTDRLRAAAAQSVHPRERTALLPDGVWTQVLKRLETNDVREERIRGLDCKIKPTGKKLAGGSAELEFAGNCYFGLRGHMTYFSTKYKRVMATQQYPVPSGFDINMLVLPDIEMDGRNYNMLVTTSFGDRDPRDGQEIDKRPCVNIVMVPSPRRLVPPPPPSPPPPANGCIRIIKEAVDFEGNLMQAVPQFTFKVDDSAEIVNDAQGRAEIADVPAGTHRVTEIVSKGWEQIQVTPEEGLVKVAAGANCAAVSFKNVQQPPALAAPKPVTVDVSFLKIFANDKGEIKSPPKNAEDARFQLRFGTDVRVPHLVGRRNVTHTDAKGKNRTGEALLYTFEDLPFQAGDRAVAGMQLFVEETVVPKNSTDTTKRLVVNVDPEQLERSVVAEELGHYVNQVKRRRICGPAYVYCWLPPLLGGGIYVVTREEKPKGVEIPTCNPQLSKCGGPGSSPP